MASGYPKHGPLPWHAAWIRHAMLGGWSLDFSYAWRSLWRKPWFLLGTFLTLVLGIGATITVFSIVNALVLRPLPLGDRTDRLVTLHATFAQGSEAPGWGDSEISFPDYQDFRQAAAFDGTGAYMARNFVLGGDEASAERVPGGSVTPDLFPLLGVTPWLGRHFTEEETAAPGLERVVMLTHGLWQRRFGADPLIIGRDVVINDLPRTVVGVLPPGFRFPERDDLYMPLRLDDARRSSRVVNAVAVLAPGVSKPQAQAELDAVAARLAAEYPDSNRDVGVLVADLRQSYVGRAERTMTGVLMGAVAFVLLIVCANLANLMLVRGAERGREMAVRAAVGASAWRLARTALTESLLLAVPASALGLLASRWALDGIRAWIPEDLPFWVRLDLDVRVAAFTAGVGLFVAITVGLVPAWRAARPRLGSDLQDAGRASSLGPAAHHLQAVLAVGQIALSLVLLVGANLMVRSLVAQQRHDLGFDDGPLLTGRVYLAGDHFDDPRARGAFFRQASATLAALPGVRVFAASSGLPGDDGGSAALAISDDRMAAGDERLIHTLSITPDYFAALGLRLIEGRGFSEAEADNADTDVALVNRALADRLWPGERPLDRRVGLRTAEGDVWFRVVGVAPDVHYEEVGESTEASRLNLYVPYGRQASRAMALVVRTDGDPARVAASVRIALDTVSATVPVYRLMPMRDLRRLTTWEQEFMGSLLSAFAAAALLLACLGVYALVAYTVERRSREIGVRLALGARPRDVFRMLALGSGRVALAGTLVGLALGVALARVLSGRLFGASADAALFAGAAIPLMLALAAATWWPAHRASRRDPTVVLRVE